MEKTFLAFTDIKIFVYSKIKIFIRCFSNLLPKIWHQILVYLADTIPGLIVFGAAVLNEHFVACMDGSQIKISRITSLIIRIFTSRPYGIVRDYLLKRLGYKDWPIFSYWVVNTLCAMTIGSALYFLVLKISGTHSDQNTMAIGTVVLANVCFGYFYGKIMDWFRKVFKVKKK